MPLPNLTLPEIFSDPVLIDPLDDSLELAALAPLTHIPAPDSYDEYFQDLVGEPLVQAEPIWLQVAREQNLSHHDDDIVFEKTRERKVFGLSL